MCTSNNYHVDLGWDVGGIQHNVVVSMEWVNCDCKSYSNKNALRFGFLNRTSLVLDQRIQSEAEHGNEPCMYVSPVIREGHPGNLHYRRSP